MPEQSLDERQADMRKRMKEKKTAPRAPQQAIVVDEPDVESIANERAPKFETEPSGSIVIRRSELYQMVWREPATKIAKRFGVSDVAVAKACRREKIPLPGLGYWAKIAAGQSLPIPKLPQHGSDSFIRFSGGHSPASEVVRAELPEIVNERSQDKRIVVPEVATVLHPFARQALITLSRAKRNAKGLLVLPEKVLDIHVSPACLSRAITVADSLIKALESRGFAVKLSETAGSKSTYNWWGSDWSPWTYARVKVMEEELGFEVLENFDRVPHIPTAEEKKQMDRGYRYGIPEYDEVPNGELTLRLSVPSSLGLRSTWNDGSRQRVEDCLNKAIAALITATQTIKNERVKAEQERLRREEEARLYAEREKRRREEEERIEKLDAQMKQWKRAQEVRAYAAAVEECSTKYPEEQPRLLSWASWIREYADRIDPLTACDEEDD